MEHYDAQGADRYDALRSWKPPVPRRVAQLLDIGPNSAVLEVGCGTGDMLRAVAELTGCSNLSGVDRSVDMLRRAQAKLPNARFIQADAAALPLADQSCDAAIGAFFIHHVPADRRPRVIAECRRVLRVGALAIITASHAQLDNGIYGRFIPEVAALDKQRFPRIADLEQWLADAGFARVERHTAADAPTRLDPAWLARVEQRHISTLDLIGEDALARGIARLREHIAAHADAPETWTREVTIVVGRMQ